MNLIKKMFIIILAIMLLLLFTGCDKQTENKTSENPAALETDAVNIADTGTKDQAAENNGGDKAQETATVESGRYEDGFVFKYNGNAVYLGDYIEVVLTIIGPETDYHESDSCTSDGIMKTYSYAGFDISTYGKNETDKFRIFSIELFDDSNSTAEGIYIGQTIAEMTAVYGSECEALPGFCYKYEKNGTSLKFDVDGDIITAITYTLLNI